MSDQLLFWESAGPTSNSTNGLIRGVKKKGKRQLDTKNDSLVTVSSTEWARVTNVQCSVLSVQ